MFALLSSWQLLIVGGIVLLLFGNRLPEVMRGMGRGVKEFQDGIRDAGNEEAEQR